VKSSRLRPVSPYLIVAAYFVIAMLGGWLLKSNLFVNDGLARLPTSSLLIFNSFFVLSGIPLSAVGDLLLLKQIGVLYIVFWPIFVGFASFAQIYFFRSHFCRAWASPLRVRLEASLQKKSLPKLPRNGVIVLLIRSVPIMPFMLGSFVIALTTSVGARAIMLLSIIGSYIYYAYFAAGYLLGSSAF
jgi:hypothetical protein